MSNAVLFEYRTAKHLWRFEIVPWQGRETFRVWPYFKGQNGEWKPCKAEYVNDALQMPMDEFAALFDALERYQHGTIKLVA